MRATSEVNGFAEVRRVDPSRSSLELGKHAVHAVEEILEASIRRSPGQEQSRRGVDLALDRQQLIHESAGPMVCERDELGCGAHDAEL